MQVEYVIYVDYFFLNSILQLQIKLFNLFSSTIFLSFTSFFILLNLIKSKINVRFNFFVSFQFSNKKIVLIFQKFSDLFECFWMFLWSKWTLFFSRNSIYCVLTVSNTKHNWTKSNMRTNTGLSTTRLLLSHSQWWPHELLTGIRENCVCVYVLWKPN